MLILVCIPIGISVGAATWSLIRGRGGFAGLVLCTLFGVISAFVGALAGQAIVGPSGPAIAVGSVAGALLAAIVEAVGWGPRPKHSRTLRPS
jgi:hypothetical protein